MRKREAALVLVVLAVLLCGIPLQLMTRSSQRALDTTLAEMETPAEVRFYQGLTEDAGAEPDHESARDPGSAATPCGTTRERLARWKGIFAELRQIEYTIEPVAADDAGQDPWQPSSAEKALIAEIRTLAACGGPIYPLDYPDVYGNNPPHWRLLPLVNALLVSDAYRAREERDDARAVDNVILAMQLADALVLEPLLLAQRTRHERYERLLQDYQGLFGDSPPSPELLAKLSAHLAGAAHREGLYAGLRGESLHIIYDYEVWQHESFIAKAREWNVVTATRRRLWRSTLFKPYFLEDQRTALEFLERIQELPEKPFYKIKDDLDRLLDEARNQPITHDRIIAVMPRILDGDFKRQGQHEIRVDLWRLRLRIDQFRLETGTLPASLDDIAKRYGLELPRDPGNGSAYNYRLDGNCYVLSSAGAKQVHGRADVLGAYGRMCPE